MDSSEPPPEEKAKPSGESEPPAPAPEPEEPPEAPPTEEEEVSLDRMWEEAYEELIEPEPPPKRKKRPRRWGGIATLAIVLIFLLLWTLMSPHVLSSVGETYVRHPEYAKWGNYTGTTKFWGSTTTWGVSLRNISAGPGNSTLDLGVLVTKVSETTANWFMRGTGIELRNVSAYDENGTFLGAMASETDLGYGVQAILPLKFLESGSYWVFVKLRFMVFEVMRIGFLPMKAVQVEQIWVDFPIQVTIP